MDDSNGAMANESLGDIPPYVTYRPYHVAEGRLRRGWSASGDRCEPRSAYSLAHVEGLSFAEVA